MFKTWYKVIYEGGWFKEDTLEAAMSNLVRTEMIYAIKRVVMEKHPLTEKAQEKS